MNKGHINALMIKHLVVALVFLVELSFHLPLQAQLNPEQSVRVVEVVEPRVAAMRFGSNANSRLLIEDVGANPLSLTELITRTPGIAESGQNGLFQTFSVRGVSGQRVQTRFAGVPISSERRAGTGASFVDPWQLQQIDVLRGPASTFFGSGAIGGVVLATPRFFRGVEAELAFENETNQRTQAIGMGNQNWSLGISNRNAGDGETPTGDTLHSGFQQGSILLQNRWTQGDLSFDGLLLSSRGQDIGRSNLLFPLTRVSGVAEESHDLLHLGLSSDNGWRAELYFHDQDSESETLLVGQRQENVSSESFDWGGRWNASWNRKGWSGEYGFDFDFRENVRGFQDNLDINSREFSSRSNLDAQQKAVGLFAVSSFDTVNHRFEFGIRQSWLRQRAQLQDRRSNRNITGYVAWQWFMSENWSVSAELASAYRVPSLTERYFTGSTGRGTSIGNQELDAETAPGFDAGLHWNRAGYSLSAHWFIQSFDNYIERVAIDAETRSFKNLKEGTVTGIELEGLAAIGGGWSLRYGAHWIEGEDVDNSPLADIPAAATNLGIYYSSDRWQLGLDWRHRFGKSDVSTIENPLDQANIVDIHYSYQLSNQTTFSVYTKNVSNDVYLISADEISTLGNQRVIGMRFHHQFQQGNALD
ncbi:MAG: outer membrane receptor protein involved in Fe transport [Kiritimatiellia bacterium]|jgi:outer membrane receptor protein involved in Fe transport